MLSAAVRICWAAEAMTGLARALGFEEEGSSYAGKAAVLREAFNRQWWIEDRNLWAVGLIPGEDGPQPVILEDVHARSLHYPQTYRVAESEKGIRALQEIDCTAVDAADGLNSPAVTVWQNSLMATGAFRYGQAELGYRLLKRAARNPIELDKMLGAFSTMNPPAWLPPDNENKIMYCWSAGPFLEAVLYGLMGIQPDAPSHALSFTPRIPLDWESATVEAYRMGEHVLDFVLEGEVWKVTHREGPCPLTLHFGADIPPEKIAPGDSVAFPLIRETPDHHTP
jgi:glycogen debranching enzyme